MSLHEKCGRWYWRFKIRGKDYEGSTGLDATKQNENASKAIEAQNRLKIEAGLEPAARQRAITFRIGAAEFLAWCHGTQYRKKPNTAKRISGSFASLSKFFGDQEITAIEAIDIERYKTWRFTEHQVKDVTVRNDLNALSLFFRYARRAGWRTDNPLIGEDKVTRPSGEDAVRIHIISPNEEERYFEHARGTLRDVAKLMLLQGPRPEEILSSRKESFDRQRGEFRILGGKSKAARRTLTLCGESIEILERRMKLEGPWLFPSSRKPGDHVRQLHTPHDSVCQDAGVSFVLYDFRHTFATRMLVEAKVDMASLAAILGHSSLRILSKYVHPTQEHQREAMKKYEAIRPAAKLRKVK
jgi:integrase